MMPCTPRNRAANILGGDEKLIELEEAGLVVMDRATRRVRHEKYRHACLLLRQIGNLVSEFFPTPIGPSVLSRPASCHPIRRTLCAAYTRRPLRLGGCGTSRRVHHRTKAPSAPGADE